MRSLSFSLLSWWLGFCLVLVGIELAYINGLVEYVFVNDSTRITIVIAFILIWQSLSCFRELRRKELYDSIIGEKNYAIERGWFFSDVVLSLGMVGTVIGFMMMLSGFADLDVTSAESAEEMITELGLGMATALTTTLVGLISSILLKLQFFMLERKIDEE